MTSRTTCLSTILILLLAFSGTLSTAKAESPLNPTAGTLFAPLLADPMEPRIAVMPKIDEKALQLDIGTSADLYRNETRTFTAGIDFGTWSLLRRAEDFKFPVDAIDYLFGFNATIRKPLEKGALPFDEASARLRISHISAHFEDGHYDADAKMWIQGNCPFTIPFVYSREFINLTTALSSPGHRVYLGYQYLYHTMPAAINPHSFQAGAEIGLPSNSYVAADFKLLPLWKGDANGSTDEFRGTWNLQAGMRLSSIGLDRVRLACSYTSGMSRHGMYFYQPESYTTLGVIVNL